MGIVVKIENNYVSITKSCYWLNGSQVVILSGADDYVTYRLIGFFLHKLKNEQSSAFLHLSTLRHMVKAAGIALKLLKLKNYRNMLGYAYQVRVSKITSLVASLRIQF